MPTLTAPPTSAVKKSFQSEVAFDLMAVFARPMMLAVAAVCVVEFEYATTSWSVANPIAQLAVRLPRYWDEVALSEADTKTSSGAPAFIADASAVEPPDFTGATCTPVLEEKPLSSDVTSVA